MASRFVFLRIRLPGRLPEPGANGVIGLTWLIVQWPHHTMGGLPARVSWVPARQLREVVIRILRASLLRCRRTRG